MGGGSQELGVLIEDEIHGTVQVRCVSKSGCILILSLGAGVHQNSITAECLRRQDVTHPVSDPPAATKIDIELFGGLAIQQHTWLAAVARASELGEVGTEVVRIQMRALGAEQRVYPLLGLLIVVSGKNTAGDTGLIGGYDHEEAMFVQPSDGFGCARQQSCISGIAQVTDIFDDGAVAIEKNSATARWPAGHGHETSAC